jgi:hypothetical protein
MRASAVQRHRHHRDRCAAVESPALPRRGCRFEQRFDPHEGYVARARWRLPRSRGEPGQWVTRSRAGGYAWWAGIGRRGRARVLQREAR